MGILDELTGKVGSMFGGTGGEQSGLTGVVMEMLAGKDSGGLSGLVQSFQEKGMGDLVSSWVGKGENQPVSAEQIKDGLGSEMIQNLSAKAGISKEETSAKLAEFLPGLIDKLTPDGTIPEGGLLAKGLGILREKL